MWRFLKKLEIEPAIPLLGINPEKTTVQKDVCTLHGSTTHNSEDREATRTDTGYNGVLLSHQK